MASFDAIVSHLASAFVMGRWEVDALVERGADALGQRWRWLRPLARRLIAAFGTEVRPARFRVIAILRADRLFRRACQKHLICIDGTQRRPPEMIPAAGPPETWIIPPLVTPGALAEWLELTAAELEWLADERGLERVRPAGGGRHYDYHWLKKRVGGTARLIECPKPRLKAAQRQILHGILDRIPAHRSAHGFVAERSIRSFVLPHVGRTVVLRTDLQDFFPSVSKARACAVFRVAGYPETVSQMLAALCTNRVPDDLWSRFPQYGGPRDQLRHEAIYRRAHLPQGAPTSPAIANLCCFRLDCRLDGLARAFGAQYTRYADDLLFSGGEDLSRTIRRFRDWVHAVVQEEGFRVQHRKTRVMDCSSRQTAAGLVMNRHINVPREVYDRLKAILHNCIRHGPATQNREGVADFRGHLQGRIAFIASVAPDRGRKLHELFDRIDWSGE